MNYLSNKNIDLAITEIETYLSENKIESKDAIRLRFMLEEILLNYQESFDESHEFTLRKKKILGHIQLTVSVAGESVNPFDCHGDEELELLRKLHADTKNSGVWTYRNGVNHISFSIHQKHKFSSTQKTIFAMITGIVLGLVSYALPEQTRTFLLEGFIDPTFNTILGMITAVAGPMVFFSLTWGVCTIGDINTLSRIGKRMIGRFMLAQFLVSAVAVIACLPFFHGSSTDSSSFHPDKIYALLLEIIPDNLVTPFTTGNTEHIIVLAVAVGIVLLLLGEKVSVLTAFVDQMNTAMYCLMSGVSVLIPFMVFFGLFKISASGQLSILLQSWKILVAMIALLILPMFLYTIIVAIRKKVSVLKLIKKASSVFIIGLMTASSGTALAENMERCRHSYGIDEKIVQFGVPLGQTIFMPGVAMFFIGVSFGVGEKYDIAFTPNWLIMAILTSVLLAVALPPIPGGMVMGLTILFGQLGIPLEAIGIAIALNIVFEYAVTGVNLFCLQMELTELAGSLDMLELETLRKKQ